MNAGTSVCEADQAAAHGGRRAVLRSSAVTPRIVVGIASSGRPAVLAETVRRLDAQSLRPSCILVALPHEEDEPALPAITVPLQVLRAPKGSATQRNAILEHCPDDHDAVLFLDDDFVLGPAYLEEFAGLLSARADVVGFTGDVVADGANGAGLSFAEADTILARSSAEARRLHVFDISGTYGCNMGFRLPMAKQQRFDENLPLYGWQEDVDYSSRMRAHGRIVKAMGIYGVHLGVKGGRTSGVRFGYSQVANPVYLSRKGSLSADYARRLIIRNLAANLRGCLRPEPHIDRRGRLRGNLIALRDLVLGTIDPKKVLCLHT